MRVRFWGVRGSVPWATPGSIGHGCNTPCVEIVDETSGRPKDGAFESIETIVIDLVRKLGALSL